MIVNRTCRIKVVVLYCTFDTSKTALKVLFNTRVLICYIQCSNFLCNLQNYSKKMCLGKLGLINTFFDPYLKHLYLRDLRVAKTCWSVWLEVYSARAQDGPQEMERN